MFPNVSEADVATVRAKLARLYGEDIAQDTFLKACERDLDPQTWSFWVYVKARGLYRHMVRDTRRHAEYNLQALGRQVVDSQESLIIALQSVPQSVIDLAIRGDLTSTERSVLRRGRQERL